MRNECQIVRDLMPLCIDHAASQDSQELVDEHIRTCESCAEIYGEMTRALPKLQSVRDSRELARTVRQMRRRKVLRAAVIVLCVFLIGVLVRPLLTKAYDRIVSALPQQPQPAVVVNYELGNNERYYVGLQSETVLEESVAVTTLQPMVGFYSFTFTSPTPAPEPVEEGE